MSERIADVSARKVVRLEVQVDREAGRIVLRRERFGPARRAILRFLRQPTSITLRLDPLASAAWELFDSRRTVGDVRRELQARFPDQHDIGPRLGRFVGTLVSHRMVALE